MIKIKKVFFVLILILVSYNTQSQTSNEIENIYNKYEISINNFKRIQSNEIKKLTPENYNLKKTNIISKYNIVIGNLVTERDAKILKLKNEINKNSELQLNKKKEIYKRQLTEQDNLSTKNGEIQIDEPKEDNIVYSINSVEIKPEYPEGIEKFFSYIKESINITPGTMLAKKIYVGFIVEKDGSLSDIKILRGINEELDQQVIKTIKKCPNWISAEMNGKKARSLMSLPIAFE